MVWGALLSIASQRTAKVLFAPPTPTADSPLAPPQADFGNHILRRVDLTSGLVTTLAGNVSGTVGSDNKGYADGQGSAASFYSPIGVAVDSAGTFAIVVRSMMGEWGFV